jgi:photosystem II stability/assembly factor-like uncharacterized protein
MMRFSRSWSLCAALFLGASPLFLRPALGQRGGRGNNQAAPPQAPRFQFVGPQPAGRIASVTGVPGDTTTYYFGAASGGIWKTTDGARTFAPIFDDQDVQAIGALAVAPSNPRIVWAGTGEAWAIRDADVMGDGVYKSTDAGATWKNMGLAETGRIGRIIVHPTNPNIVLVCALGRTTGPQEERGIYRTTDGGDTWQRVLFVNPNTGCSGMSLDASDPKTLFAGTWEVVMHTYAMYSGGAGSGVYVSRDTGATWKRVEAPGLPKSPVGKIDVAVAPSNSKRVYALIQTPNQGSLWRSDDGGTAWQVVSWDRTLIGRAGYYIRMEVNPQNDLEVLIANSTFHRSLDGGLTFPISGGGCGDCHDIWMDPRNPAHWVVTGDAGAGYTRNHGQSFTTIALPIGQMYHVAIDDQVPYWIYANRQDDGTMRGPNTSPVPVPNVPSYGRGGGRGGAGGGGGPPPDDNGFAGFTPPSQWDAGIGGCESGFTLPTPHNPDIIWATCYGNTVTRYDAHTGRARSVSPWIHTLDSPPNEAKYRCHWTPPLAIDPFEPNTVYYGCQVVFKTSNAGQSWQVISPDLSTNDPSRIVSSGGVVGDNLGQFYGEVVFAIAPSDMQKGLIWAGTNDGKIWNTLNGGTTWNDVTKNIAGLPAWGTVRKIEPSHFEAATAYVTVDFHLMDDRTPYIYKTTDFGKSWKKITGDLPTKHPLAYALSIAENPNRKGMLFAGTGNGFYYSMDDGMHWTQFKDGLPAAPVTWIVVAKLNHDVVASTYGRGLYVLRDITMLEQSDKIAADADVVMYEPHAGFRAARAGSADFNFRLKTAPKDSLAVDILDSAGTVVRTMKTMGRAGLNRVTWDLHYDGPKQVELRTTPPDNPHIWEEARYKGKTTRPIVHWGIQGPQRSGPLALPGRYSVRLTVNSTPYSQRFTVVKDPSIPTTDVDLAASTRTQIRIRDDLNSATDMVNRLEVMRKQLEDQRKANAGKGDVLKQLDDLDKKMMDVELQLVTRSDLHSDDKWYVEKYKVVLNLIWLSGEVGTGAGDVAGGAEFRPTDASMAVLAEIEKDLSAAKAAFTKLIDTDIKAFNEAMAGKITVIMDSAER